MAQLIVRNLENEVKKRLQLRAIRHGCSMEEEVRDILRNAVKDDYRHPTAGLGTELAALFAGIGFDAEIAELHGHVIRPASFDD
jgi:plasmid stability protein